VPIALLLRARLSAMLLFALTGLVFATWAARIPARKADLGLSDGQLALAFVGLNAGAVLGLQLGAAAVTRLGSRPVLAVALPAFALLLLPLAVAPNLPLLTAALALFALTNSVVDVALNDQGVGLQRHYHRSVLSGLHAMHSLGGLLGGGLAALAAHAGLSVARHFALIATAAAALGLLAAAGPLHRQQPHPPARQSRASLLRGWTARVLLLGGLALVFTFAEGSALDWGAVLLREDRHAAASLAAIALAVFQGAVAAGRLIADRLINTGGPVRVFRAAALLAGGGLAGGLLADTATTALAGLALLGLGLAPLLPIAVAAAGTDDRLPVPVAVARVTTLGYLGSFTGPLLIGALSHPLGLSTALLLPAVALATTAAAAHAVRSAPINEHR
jgi:MFS family permease